MKITSTNIASFQVWVRVEKQNQCHNNDAYLCSYIIMGSFYPVNYNQTGRVKSCDVRSPPRVHMYIIVTLYNVASLVTTDDSGARRRDRDVQIIADYRTLKPTDVRK